MGFASRGYLVIVLGATAERRNLFFRSDLGLPWIRSFSLRLSRYATGVGSSVPRASRQPSPIPVRANDIDEQIETRLAPFHVEGDPGHQGAHRRRPGRCADTLVLAQVEC